MSHDGGGQHTREQPTKLSQRVQEGSVVCLHVGALQGNVKISHHQGGQLDSLTPGSDGPALLIRRLVCTLHHFPQNEAVHVRARGKNLH